MRVTRVDIYTSQCRKNAQEQPWRSVSPVGARSGLQPLPGVQGLSSSWQTHLECGGYNVSSDPGFEYWILHFLAVRSWTSYLTSLYARVLICNGHETNASSERCSKAIVREHRQSTYSRTRHRISIC